MQVVNLALALRLRCALRKMEVPVWEEVQI